ncbi:MAG: homocysteine S-methyltransferase family protein [Phycisphaerae bacterium]|jgi:5-methyltetrahydrofolate--homocysteine methyltransferase
MTGFLDGIKEDFLKRIRRGDTVLCDGGLGTMLFQRGLDPGGCPELVNLDHPEWLAEIARAYLDAGADIATTNTFGASPLKLAQYDLVARTEEINARAVGTVKTVVFDRAYVGGSIGPSGKILKPYGDTEPEAVYESYVQQAGYLVEGGVDLILVETMIDLAEATLAVKAVKELVPTMPVTAAMTFDLTPRGFFTVMGTTVQQAVDGLTEAGADVIGSNCGNGIEKMVQLAAEFRNCCDRPLIIQSNAGLPETKDGKLVYNESPAFMAENARKLLEVGVSIIGGCCGTTPEHIAAIRKTLFAGHQL